MLEATGERSRDAFRGCLLGGAVGDALGAPVEFLDLGEIRRRHGARGVKGLVAGEWPAGTITDDTQMTLFTAEALIRAAHAGAASGGEPGGDRAQGSRSASASESPSESASGSRMAAPSPSPSGSGFLRRAYLRWLHTQGEFVAHEVIDGWLVGVPALHARRAPGNTCLSALREGGWGSPRSPANGSKGCGGVMRVAPVGLVDPARAFEAGCEAAAITHGHPTGFLAAGFLAQVIGDVSRGAALGEAARATLARLAREPGHEETSAAVEEALALAAEASRGVGPGPEQVEALGGGWVAEEALAIGLFCALTARDFAHGVLLAVNHGGDSDSTGAIAGNLLGLVCGEHGVPGRWLAGLELRDVVVRVADDLWAHFGDGRPLRCEDGERYPGD